MRKYIKKNDNVSENNKEDRRLFGPKESQSKEFERGKRKEKNNDKKMLGKDFDREVNRK